MRFLSSIKFVSYLRVALLTTVNIVLNAVTLGRYIWLEGRVRNGIFMNWARRFCYMPEKFVQPSTETEIVELVKNSRNLRVFGSGHSFNTGVVSDETLVSLDNYSGLVHREGLKEDQLAVKGGTRVRDVVKLLFDRGLAFEALPSHDAQSIAGILSTDVHGTGRDWGFVSESVVRLRLVDGNGNIHECQPSDDLFKAAIGGIGAVGIITEVVVQGVRRFNVKQKVEMRDISFDKENDKNDFDQLLRDGLIKNDHFSIYLFPFTKKCQINTWNCREKDQTILGRLQEFIEITKGHVLEFVNISIDALAAAWVGNFLAYTGRLPQLGRTYGFIRPGSDLLLESNKGFNRTIYHLHQELEFTVPYEDTFEACKRFIELYEDLYEQMYPSGLPYTLFEVRFTPEHDNTLIGAGRGRHSTWIDLVCTDSCGFERYYGAAQRVVREIGARPHLGKYCEIFTKADMATLHGDNFTTFLNLIEKHDPDGRFANGFTRRLLGHG